MKFGPVPLKDAEGALLAHSIRVEGAVFRKGRLLSAADLAALAQAGVEEVTAARFEPGDMDEDSAAAAIAAAVAGEGLEVAAPFTGRVNLFAPERGVLTVEAGQVDRLNLLDESITLATLPPWSLVERRQMVATVKGHPVRRAGRRGPADRGPAAGAAPAQAPAGGAHPDRAAERQAERARQDGRDHARAGRGAERRADRGETRRA